MAKHKILVVEDDENIRELISFNLQAANYTVVEAETGEAGIKKAQKTTPDLILLDLMLPEMDGLDVCRQLKSDASTKDIPIIMVTAKGEESDIVTGLELGADDYVTKPFRPKELVARIRNILRRMSRINRETDTEIIKIHGIEIHQGKRAVKVNGKAIDLTYTEFQILCLLAKRSGWVFTRYQIVDSVKGDDYPVTDRSVDVQIVGLRKKLGKAGKNIETIRGVGYKLKEE
ncbi:MAG: response regulator transcription factor [Kiritimatiellae bacterium]|nr:response regulator transcription factor [Kiritimatiellia bacterium]